MAAAAAVDAKQLEHEPFNKPSPKLGQGNDKLSETIRLAKAEKERLQKLKERVPAEYNVEAFAKLLDAIEKCDFERLGKDIPEPPASVDAPQQEWLEWMQKLIRQGVVIIDTWSDAVGKSAKEQAEHYELLDEQIVRTALMGHPGQVGEAAGWRPSLSELEDRATRLSHMFLREIIETQSTNPLDEHGNPDGWGEAIYLMCDLVAERILDEQIAQGVHFKQEELEPTMKRLATCLSGLTTDGDGEDDNDFVATNPTSGVLEVGAPIKTQIQTFDSPDVYYNALAQPSLLLARFVYHSASDSLMAAATSSKSGRPIAAIVTEELIQAILTADQGADVNVAYQHVRSYRAPKVLREFPGENAFEELRMLIVDLHNLKPKAGAQQKYLKEGLVAQARHYLTSDLNGVLNGRSAASNSAVAAARAGNEADAAKRYLQEQQDAAVPVDTEYNPYDDDEDMATVNGYNVISAYNTMWREGMIIAAATTDADKATKKLAQARLGSAILEVGLGTFVSGVFATFATAAIGLQQHVADATKLVLNPVDLIKQLDDTRYRTMVTELGKSGPLSELTQLSQFINGTRNTLLDKGVITDPTALLERLALFRDETSVRNSTLFKEFDATIYGYLEVADTLRGNTNETVQLAAKKLDELNFNFATSLKHLRDYMNKANQFADQYDSDMKAYIQQQAYLHEVFELMLTRVNSIYRDGMTAQVQLLLTTMRQLSVAQSTVVRGLSDAVTVLQNTINRDAPPVALYLDSLLGHGGPIRGLVGFTLEPILWQFSGPVDALMFSRTLKALRVAKERLMDLSTMEGDGRRLGPGQVLADKKLMQHFTAYVGAAFPSAIQVTLADPGNATAPLYTATSRSLVTPEFGVVGDDQMMMAVADVMDNVNGWIKQGHYSGDSRTLQTHFSFVEAKNMRIDVTKQIHALNNLEHQVTEAYTKRLGAVAAARTIALITDEAYHPTPGEAPLLYATATSVMNRVYALGASIHTIVSAAKSKHGRVADSQFGYLFQQKNDLIDRTTRLLNPGQGVSDSEYYRKLDALDMYCAHTLRHADEEAQKDIVLAMQKQFADTPSDRFKVALRAQQKHIELLPKIMSQRSIWSRIRHSTLVSGGTRYLSTALKCNAIMGSTWVLLAFMSAATIEDAKSMEFVPASQVVGNGMVLGLGAVLLQGPLQDFGIAYAVEHAIHKKCDISELSHDDRNRLAVVRAAIKRRKNIGHLNFLNESLSNMGVHLEYASHFAIGQSIILMQPTQVHDIVALMVATTALDAMKTLLLFARSHTSFLNDIEGAGVFLSGASFVANTLVRATVAVSSMGSTAFTLLRYQTTRSVLQVASIWLLQKIVSWNYTGPDQNSDRYIESIATIRIIAAMFPTMKLAGTLWQSVRNLSNPITLIARRRKTRFREELEQKANGKDTVAPVVAASKAASAALNLDIIAEAHNTELQMTSLKGDNLVTFKPLFKAGLLIVFLKFALPLLYYAVLRYYFY